MSELEHDEDLDQIIDGNENMDQDEPHDNFSPNRSYENVETEPKVDSIKSR